MYTDEELETLVKGAIVPAIQNSNLKMLEFVTNCNNETNVAINELIEGLRRQEYERNKLISYINSIFFQKGLSSEKFYNDYCAEFDRLYKEETEKTE